MGHNACKHCNFGGIQTRRRELYYKMQFDRTERNKDKRMNRHLRSHPNDLQTAQRYGDRSIKLNTKGRKRLAA